MESPSNTVFDDDRDSALKGAVLIFGGLVYLAAVVYSAIHNISLMLKGVAPDGRFLAILGVICLEITAVALPLALHFWCHGWGHKIPCIVFYILVAGLIMMNVIADYNAHAGSTMPGWVGEYVSWITPITPVICALGWSILWAIDPVQVERAMANKVKTLTKKAYYRQKAQYATRDAEYAAMVESAARRDQLEEGMRALGYRSLPALDTRHLATPTSPKVAKKAGEKRRFLSRFTFNLNNQKEPGPVETEPLNQNGSHPG